MNDFLALLTARTDLEFKYVESEKSHSGGFAGYSADLVPVAYINNKPSVNWPLSDPFMTMHYVSIETAGGVEAKTQDIGVLMNMSTQGVIHLESWQDHSLKKYEDLKSLLDDVRNGNLSAGYIANDIAYTSGSPRLIG